MTVEPSKTYAVPPFAATGCCKSLTELPFFKFHDTVTVVRFGLRKPNIYGKPVASVDTLLSLLIFNIAFDTSVNPTEGHHVELAGCYTFLAYTGAGLRRLFIMSQANLKTERGMSSMVDKPSGMVMKVTMMRHWTNTPGCSRTYSVKRRSAEDAPRRSATKTSC